METVNLLKDLSISDGIQVVLGAVRKWADFLVSPTATNVSSVVRQHAKEKRDIIYHVEIDKWPPKRFWEELIGDFYSRMSGKKPIQNVQRPALFSSRRECNASEIDRRAADLASMTWNMSIDQALDFFDETITQWSLECEEEWFGQEHAGQIFYLLAQITEH